MDNESIEEKAKRLEEMRQTNEAISELKSNNIHPDHYKVGGIEPIEYIEAKLTPEQFEGFLVGNIIKYVSRYQYKNGVEDLKKAQKYLDLLIELLS